MDARNGENAKNEILNAVTRNRTSVFSVSLGPQTDVLSTILLRLDDWMTKALVYRSIKLLSKKRRVLPRN